MTDRILVLDVDGTMVARGQPLKRDLRDILVLLAERGWEIVLATGRRLHQLQDILGEIPVAAVLSSEGATITVQGTTVYEARLRPDQWRCAVSLAAEHGLTPVICTEDAAYASDMNEDIRYAATYADPSPTFGPLEGLVGIAPSLVMLVTAGPGATPGIAQEVSAVCGVQAVVSAPGFISVTPAGNDKGTALTRLLRERRSACTIVAAGDSLNDIPLLQAAGHRIARPTAPAELLSLAHIVADPIDQGGLVQSLIATCN